MTASGDRGKRDAIAQSVLEYRDALLFHAFTHLRDWAMAEDVFQESLIVVLNKWEEYREGTSLYSWVRRIVWNKTMEALRARSREQDSEELELAAAVSELLDARSQENDGKLFARMKRALRECMARLSEMSIRLIVGFYWELKPCRALAKESGKSEYAVRHSLVRIRDRLRKCVKEKLESAE